MELDRFAEEVFRRLMALYGRMRRVDAIAGIWEQLQRNLAELGLDPEPASTRLYSHLARQGRSE